MGLWIEMLVGPEIGRIIASASAMGLWIEISSNTTNSLFGMVSLCDGAVD